MSLDRECEKRSDDTVSPARSALLAQPSRALARMCTTRANAQLGLACDTIVSVALLQAGLRHSMLGVLAIALTVCAGLFVFSFFEYAMHRWLFHGPIRVFEQGHLVHHQQPTGYDSLPFFAPPAAMLLLAAALHYWIPSFALLFAGAFAAGYAAYGISHWIMHSVRFRHPWLRRWAADHHIHHFHDDKNYGVTSPLWDIVLRTRYVSARSRATMQGPGLR